MSYAGAFARTAKRQLKVAIAHSLIATGRVRHARQGRAGDLSVLMYHGVLPDVAGPAAYGDLFVSTSNFARHLRHLKSHYQPMSLDQIVDAVSSNTPFPPRAVAVTFDDGYENTVKVALPLLAAAGIPATVFVVSDFIGGARYLWFDCLRLLVRRAWEKHKPFELGSDIRVHNVPPLTQEHHYLALNVRILNLPIASRGEVLAEIERTTEREGLTGRFPEFALTTWSALRDAVSGGFLSVGSHAAAHGDLSAMSLEEQRTDLQRSRQRIEQELGVPCVSIAYPYGRWNADTLVAARGAGYQCAFTTEHGFNLAADEPLRFKRIMAGDKGHLSILAARLAGSWTRTRQ